MLYPPTVPGVEIDREVDGRWIAEVTSVPGALAYGATPHEAVTRARAIADSVRRHDAD